jgi:protein-tyrosine sulfotransferase
VRDVLSRLGRLSKFYRALDLIRLAASLSKRYPLNNAGCTDCNPLFIIGSGRSGNTLLRAILVAHGEFAIPPESYVLGAVIREYYRFNFLPWPILARLIISRFESHSQFPTWELNVQPLYGRLAGLPEKERNLARALDLFYKYYAEKKLPRATRWGDKTPMNTLHLDEIDAVFPNAQYIHMIRDGRDVTASYVSSGLYEDLDAAIQRWLTSVNQAQRLGARVGAERYQEVRYEVLVSQPEETLRIVSRFLGTRYEPAMLNFPEIAGKLGDSDLPHHSSIWRSINPDSIGRWKRRLSRAQQQRVEEGLRDKLVELGY